MAITDVKIYVVFASLIYSPDSTSVHGSRVGEFEGIGSM